MSARSLEVPVDDDDRDDDGDDVHDERKEKVLGNERNGDGRRWEDLGYQQQEHDQRQQNGNAHGHLLAGVSWQVEHADTEERDEDAWDDEVDCVEERFSTNVQRESDESLAMAIHVVVCVVNHARTVCDVPRWPSTSSFV